MKNLEFKAMVRMLFFLMMEYEYRVVGINLESTPAPPPPDPAKASSQLNVSREFIEKEFA